MRGLTSGHTVAPCCGSAFQALSLCIWVTDGVTLGMVLKKLQTFSCFKMHLEIYIFIVCCDIFINKKVLDFLDI